MFKFLSFDTIKGPSFPGVAKRRPEIQEVVWSRWIALKSFTSCPAFAGMMKKNLNIEFHQ
jgi:hypothetical protein